MTRCPDMTPVGAATPGLASARRFVLMVTLMPAVVLAQPPDQQPQRECRELDAVQYRPPTAVPLHNRVVITSLRQSAPATDSTREEKLSPQGTARLVFLERPDFSGEGPYSTHIAVTGNKVRPLGLMLEFRRHANTNVQADWLNEKLLFIRVWWGRIVSTDLVLNVETGRLIYAEEADYVGTMTPCDERKHHG